MPTGFKVPLTFKIQQGNAPSRSETLSQDIIKIGKATSSHLHIEDESVSRMHAVVEVTLGDDGRPRVQIIDLGSTRGTFVNGQRVNKTVLRDGDSIGLGEVRIVLGIGRPETAATGPTISSQGVPIAQPSMPAGPSGPYATPMAVAGPSSMTATAVVPPLASPSLPPIGAALPAGVQRAFMDPSAVELQDGSQAVEVTAMFGSAVIDVKHYANPQATGRVSGPTKMLRYGGYALIGVGLVCFGIQLQRSGQDAANRDHHDQDKNFVYMPMEPIQGLELGWLLSLLAGATLCTISLARSLSEKEPRDFRIGSTVDAEFKVPSELLSVPELPLVHSTGSSYEVLFTPQMRGDLTDGNQVTPLADLVSSQRARPSGDVQGAYAVNLPARARLKLDLGENTFLVASVPPPRHHPPAFDLDWGFLAYLGGAFLGAMIMVALMFSIPPDSKTLSGSGDDDAAQYAKYLIKPPEEKQEEVQTDVKTGKDDPGGKGRRAKGAEGKMGNKNAADTGHKYGIKGPADNQDLHMAKVYAEQEAQQAGVLGWLNGNQGVHGPTSIFGQDNALGNDAENALGNLMGDQVGDALGAGGLGLQGTGAGGGGTGEGTIGLGNFGTIGHGGGGGNGQGYGSGAGTLGGRHAGVPTVIPGQADVHGALDKDIIRRVIRYHSKEIKFCYDQELQKNPNLNGRVVVAFTISGDGSVLVANTASSTMGDAAVDNCVVEVIRRLAFPKPEGGGLVQVSSYPFVFKAD